MLLDIPFEIGQEVWVWENNPIKHEYQTEVRDHLGFYYETHYYYEDCFHLVKHFFYFGLLDKYKIKEIFLSEDSCRKYYKSAWRD